MKRWRKKIQLFQKNLDIAPYDKENSQKHLLFKQHLVPNKLLAIQIPKSVERQLSMEKPDETRDERKKRLKRQQNIRNKRQIKKTLSQAASGGRDSNAGVCNYVPMGEKRLAEDGGPYCNIRVYFNGLKWS